MLYDTLIAEAVSMFESENRRTLMRAVNQDAEEATVETDSPIDVLRKTDSYQVRLGASFQCVSCLSVSCCHILQGLVFEQVYILEFLRVKIHVSVEWSSKFQLFHHRCIHGISLVCCYQIIAQADL